LVPGSILKISRTVSAIKPSSVAAQIAQSH